jgi:hypothetical protein
MIAVSPPEWVEAAKIERMRNEYNQYIMAYHESRDPKLLFEPKETTVAPVRRGQDAFIGGPSDFPTTSIDIMGVPTDVPTPARLGVRDVIGDPVVSGKLLQLFGAQAWGGKISAATQQKQWDIVNEEIKKKFPPGSAEQKIMLGLQEANATLPDGKPDAQSRQIARRLLHDYGYNKLPEATQLELQQIVEFGKALRSDIWSSLSPAVKGRPSTGEYVGYDSITHDARPETLYRMIRPYLMDPNIPFEQFPPQMQAVLEPGDKEIWEGVVKRFPEFKRMPTYLQELFKKRVLRYQYHVTDPANMPPGTFPRNADLDEIRSVWLKERRNYPLYEDEWSNAMDAYVKPMLQKVEQDALLQIWKPIINHYPELKDKWWSEIHWIDQYLRNMNKRKSPGDEYVATKMHRLIDGFLHMSAGESLAKLGIKKASETMTPGKAQKIRAMAEQLAAKGDPAAQWLMYDFLGLTDVETIPSDLMGALIARFYGGLLGIDSGIANLGQSLFMQVYTGMLEFGGFDKKHFGGDSKIQWFEHKVYRPILQHSNPMQLGEFFMRGWNFSAAMEYAIKNLGLSDDLEHALPIALGRVRMLAPGTSSEAGYFSAMQVRQRQFDPSSRPIWQQSGTLDLRKGDVGKMGSLFMSFPLKSAQMMMNDVAYGMGSGDVWRVGRVLMSMGIITLAAEFVRRVGIDISRIYSPRGIWGFRWITPPIALITDSILWGGMKTGAKEYDAAEMDRLERDIAAAMKVLLVPEYRWMEKRAVPALQMAEWKKRYGRPILTDYKGRPFYLTEPQLEQYVNKLIGEDGIRVGGLQIGGKKGIPAIALLYALGLGPSEIRQQRTDAKDMLNIQFKWEQLEDKARAIDRGIYKYGTASRYATSLRPKNERWWEQWNTDYYKTQEQYVPPERASTTIRDYGRKGGMFPEPEGWRQDRAKEAQEIAQEFSTQSGRIYRNMSPVAKGDWLATLKKEGWIGKKGDEAWKAWADSNLSGQDRFHDADVFSTNGIHGGNGLVNLLKTLEGYSYRPTLIVAERSGLKKAVGTSKFVDALLNSRYKKQALVALGLPPTKKAEIRGILYGWFNGTKWVGGNPLRLVQRDQVGRPMAFLAEDEHSLFRYYLPKGNVWSCCFCSGKDGSPR